MAAVGIVLHHEVADVAPRVVRPAHEAGAEAGDVVGDLGIVHVRGVVADVAHDAIADRALLLLGDRRRADVAQVREDLRDGARGVERKEQGGDDSGDHGRGGACCYDGRARCRPTKASGMHPIMTQKLTHIDERGAARMVDVAGKPETHRIAVAGGSIRMRPETFELVRSGTSKKGDVLGVARVAAIQAAKKTSELVPLCHPVPLTSVAVDFTLDDADSRVECRATVECTARTGVEMEALTAVQVALLTIYDMCKAVDRGMVMHDIRLLEKRGGKSGDYVAP